MRRRLRYFRLFGLMTVIFILVVAVYLGAKKRAGNPTNVTVEPAPKPHRQIIVAARDLVPRTLLTPELLEEREVSFAPQGTFSSKDEVSYRLTTTFIQKGEPIFRQHVTPPLKEASAAYLIPPGRVGMALVISRPETVPPLRAGDYISIHAVLAGVKVRTIVPRAMILAINNRIGEISLTAPSSSITSQQQSQTPSPEKEQMVLLVALSPKEAKAVALAMDNDATFYYTLHPAPSAPFPPPGLEEDLELQELAGSSRVSALIIKKRHGELPQPPRPSEPLQPRHSPPIPVTFTPDVAAQLGRLDRSIRNLQQRFRKLEQQSTSTPHGRNVIEERQVTGVIGDQIVTFSIPLRRADEGGGRR